MTATITISNEKVLTDIYAVSAMNTLVGATKGTPAPLHRDHREALSRLVHRSFVKMMGMLGSAVVDHTVGAATTGGNKITQEEGTAAVNPAATSSTDILMMLELKVPAEFNSLSLLQQMLQQAVVSLTLAAAYAVYSQALKQSSSLAALDLIKQALRLLNPPATATTLVPYP